MPEMTTWSSNTGAEVQPRPRVLLCGDARTPEFEVVAREVASVVPSEDVSQVTDLAGLRTMLTDSKPPDLLVIVQTWPDEFHFTDVLALPGFGPFSRLICCHGPWCVSDGRNRQDFPLALRVPLEHLRAALFREWRQLTAPAPMDAPLPWTAGRDEVFGGRWAGAISPIGKQQGNGSNGGEAPFAVNRGPIRVRSQDAALSGLWKAVVRAAGLSLVDSAHPASGETILWDVDLWQDSVAAEWAVLLEQHPATRIVALSGFLTPDSEHRLRIAGAVDVVSKLMPLNELIQRIASQSPAHVKCG